METLDDILARLLLLAGHYNGRRFFPLSDGYGNYDVTKGIKAYSDIFVYLIALYFLYFYVIRSWKRAAQFGGHFIAIWLLMPIFKNLAIFYLTFSRACSFDLDCAWSDFFFMVSKEGFF